MKTLMSSGVDANIYLDLNSGSKIKNLVGQNEEKAIKEAAKQFESFFVNLLMKEMRNSTQSVREGGMFDSSEYSTYQEMFDQQISLEISNKGSFGIADVLTKQIMQWKGKELKEEAK